MSTISEKTSVFIIGAGQLGSRHLQALKSVALPLDISVIDPQPSSLRVAQERYESIPGNSAAHAIQFLDEIPRLSHTVGLAIVATNSNVRKAALDALFARNNVKYLILEKILFDKLDDYQSCADFLQAHRAKAYVNCSMRKMTFYRDLAARTRNSGGLIYQVTGSRYGLITNSIHYLDHMAYLTGCSDFSLETSGLSRQAIESKRKGFLELDGTLLARFGDGSVGVFTCLPDGDLPVQVEIANGGFRCISRENENKAWVASRESQWRFQEVEARIPYQSQMTSELVRDILQTGSCELPEFSESIKIHRQLAAPLLEYVNGTLKMDLDHLPFT